MSEEKEKAGASKAPANTKVETPQKSERELKLEKELETAKKVIESQGNAIKTLEVEKKAGNHKVKTINGVHYRFLGKGNLIINQTPMPAEDVFNNDDLCIDLIKKGSGLFVEFKEQSKKGGKK